MADAVAIGLRAAASAASLLAAGLPIFIFLHGDLLESASHRIRSRVVRIALLALALVLLHAIVEPVRLAGDWNGLLDFSLHALLLSSDFGTTTAVRAIGLIIIAISVLARERLGETIAIVGATLVAASFALMGHTASDPQRSILAPLLLIHLIAIAFWFGSLGPLLTITRFEQPAVAGALIERFSRTAILVVPFILLAGLAMAGLLLPDVESISTPYGLSLTAKIVGFSVLMALASLNKWRLGPGIAHGVRSAHVAFRYSVLIEWVLILAVVTITAVMTSLFSPSH